MRRRAGVPPDGLVTFDGREFTTAAEWESAFEAWSAARAVWERDHPGVVLLKQVLSGCPWGSELPHGGVWERPSPDDGEGVRCREHDLPASRH